MISPKERFLMSKEDAAYLLDVVNHPRFLRAVDAALLQMQSNYGSALDERAAAALHHELCGAKLFIRELVTLAEPPKPKPTQIGDNLKQFADKFFNRK